MESPNLVVGFIGPRLNQDGLSRECDRIQVPAHGDVVTLSPAIAPALTHAAKFDPTRIGGFALAGDANRDNAIDNLGPVCGSERPRVHWHAATHVSGHLVSDALEALARALPDLVE